MWYRNVSEFVMIEDAVDESFQGNCEVNYLSSKRGFFRMLPLVTYLLLYPFYFFRSGIPQISDFVLVLGISVVVLMEKKLTVCVHKFLVSTVLFAIYTFFVNCVTALLLDTSKPLLPSMYYLYNTIVVGFVIATYRTHRSWFFKIVFWTTTISMLLQVGIILVRMDFLTLRHIGFFNNANQLGRFALATLVIIAITYRKVKVSRMFLLLIVLSSTLLAILSLSKAAMVSCAVVVVPLLFGLLQKKDFRRSRILLLILAIILLVILMVLFGNMISNFIGRSVRNAQMRLMILGKDSDDSLEMRGYARIKYNPQFVFYGAGEGILPNDDPRYDDPYMSGELHSSFGTLLFSYGIVGFSLYLAIIIFATDFRDIYSICSIIAIQLRGLTHQGLRATEMWVILAIMFLVKLERRREHRE